MDIDQFMKSAAENHMELTMLMQTDNKLPSFPGADVTINPMKMQHFSNNSDYNIISFEKSSQFNSPTFANPPFSGDAENRSSAMREMIFRMAVMQPVHIDPEALKPPKRRNVRLSTDPQSVAARRRRERISERIRVLQRMVPGGTKMDTASMLDEAIHYVKFLKTQVRSLETAAAVGVGFPVTMSGGGYNGGGGRERV